MTTNEQQQRNVSDIVYREDLYPRITHDPALVQRYADNLEQLPPIEVNQHNELIDGFHRLSAHREKSIETIQVFVTETKDEDDHLKKAIHRNVTHGKKYTVRDKRKIQRILKALL